MADLVSQANRLNDVEINNNAPVSSQTFRRVGSSINFLLDFFNIPNGATTFSGSLSEIVADPEILSFTIPSLNSMVLNQQYNLFTFTGSADRHLSWHVLNGNGFGITGAFPNTLMGYAPTTINSSNYPFDRFQDRGVAPLGVTLNAFHKAVQSIGNQATNLFTIYVDGIQAGTCGASTINTTFELFKTPTGNHTVSIAKNNPTLAGANPISLTFHKIVI